MYRSSAAVAVAALVLSSGLLTVTAEQAPGAPAPPSVAAPDPSKPQVLALSSGTRARYRVTEQLAGISFPNDAVGTTEGVTGSIVLNPDGSLGSTSRIVVDLKTLNSDQGMRDGYIQRNTLETEKFPTMVVVPKRAVGLPRPLPSGMGAQAGFQLVSDVTLHGVTKEVTWNVIATFAPDSVSGQATTAFDFPMFNLTKPSLARLMSVADQIRLEVEFKATRKTQ